MYPGAMATFGELQQAGMGYIPSTVQVFEIPEDERNLVSPK
jgi:hypothetical protein